MAPSRRTVSVDGADLHVEERGDGVPLLLLHGMMGTGDTWRRVFDLNVLARSHRVITPDARGHGRSSNPGGVFTIARLAQDALAILDALGSDRVRAVGMSLGAKTLLHLATMAPSRVERMILVSGAPRFPEATRALFREAAAMDHTPAEWERMRAVHVHGDEQIAALWKLPRRIADDPIDMNFTPEHLAAITAKTLIVSGDRDPFYPVELALDLYRGIRGSALWVVPNAMHCPVFFAERDAFAQTATAFLGS
jgi:pimeloyl-ACP methyl ester carboxylesterase